MNSEYTQSLKFENIANVIEKIISVGLTLTPWVNLIAFFGFFVNRGYQRKLHLLLLVAGVGNILIVALCWPVQLRYYYPSIPFFFMAAALTIQSVLPLFARLWAWSLRRFSRHLN